MRLVQLVYPAALAVALAACGGNGEQAQAQSPAVESTTPAGNAGPPPGAAPASGLGDANSQPTSAPVAPSPADGSNVAADGGDATATGGTTADAAGGTTQGQQPQAGTDAARTGSEPSPPTQ